jgi:hypothetical protein
MTRSRIWTTLLGLVVAAALVVAPITVDAQTMQQIHSRIGGTAGATLAEGDVVAIDATDGKVYKADADDSTRRPAIGIIGKGGAANDEVEIVTRGILGGLSSLTKGAPIYLSTTAGARTQSQPAAYGQKLGVAISATVMTIDVGSPNNTLADSTVTTAKLAAGALSADAAGRGKMATGLFDEATVDDKFAAGAIDASDRLKAASVTTDRLAANAVTAAKVTTTMATGFINVPLESLREVLSNDIGNAATAAATGSGGILAKDTHPILERINGATDKALRVNWAAGNADAVTFSFAYPPDLDDTAAVVVNVLAKMGGATDTPTITVAYFEGVGDTDAGGATGALSTTLTKVTRSIAAGDVGPYPNAATVTLNPGAHANDAVHVHAIWIEYTRK